MDAHSHLEIERKYDVGGSVPVPNLAAVPGVATAVEFPPVELRADYFDTGGGILGDRKITLRRRVGGPDEGWHIKSAAAGGRMETHFPLGGQEANVPEAVLDVVRVHTRADPLRPVARVCTQRSVVRLLSGMGALLAEFCDDEVRARAVGGVELTWREWEVELGPAGTVDLLDGVEAVLLKAGAAPSTHASKLRRVLDAAGPGPRSGPRPGPRLAASTRSGRQETGPAEPNRGEPKRGQPERGQPQRGQSQRGEPEPEDPDPAGKLEVAGPGKPSAGESRTDEPGPDDPSAAAVLTAAFRAGLETLKHWDPLVRRDTEDAVHQMRIAARTLRSLLHTYSDLFAPEACGRLEEGLRGLGRLLAGARDAEVVRDMVDRRCGAVPDGIPATVRNQLWAGKQDERQDHMARLRRRLCGARYFALLNDLDAFVHAPPLLLTAAGPAGRVLEARVERGLAEVLGLAERAAAAEGQDARVGLLHEVRKTAKRLRYAVKAVAVKDVGAGGGRGDGTEGVGFALGVGPSARMHLAAEVQDALGAHRDSVMFQQHVRDSARRARKEGRNTFAYGVLYGAELAVQDQSVREAEAALERLRAA